MKSTQGSPTMHSISHTQRLRSFLALALLLTTLGLPACGNFCVSDTCFGGDLEDAERNFDSASNEFTITGEVGGDDISHSFKVGKEKNIDDLSFGVSNANLFYKYGAIKKIDILNANALKTYMNNYVIPQKNCPAEFMKDNIETMMLIAATDDIARELEDYDIPFDGKGTSFNLTGHDLTHISNRYLENGESINLTIPKTIGVLSNVGSANRKVHYFLVTKI